MRFAARCFAIAVVLVSASTAAAGDLQISADAPLAGLPAVSKDGGWYARPIRVQPAGCSGEQLLVQLGTIGGPREDGKSELLVVKDECAKGQAAAEKNIGSINDTLKSGKFKSVGKEEVLAIPTDIETPQGTVKVAASGKSKCVVSIGGSSTDRWTVTVDGHVSEVRGWYSGKNADGAGYVSVRVAVTSSDTGSRGREQWIDFWPEGGASAGDGSPVDVGTRFMSALKKQDATGLAAMMSTPFWKVGLTPTGKKAKKCKSKNKAKNDAQLRQVAVCMIGSAPMYKGFDDADAIAEIDMREFPAELKKHRKKVQKLFRDGHRLVRYHVNDQGFYVFVILVLDPDTDFQTVSAVLESVDVEAPE